MAILDAPPPASAPQQPSLAGLAGQPSPDTQGGLGGAEGASMQAAVAQKLAMADKLMQEASAIMPNLAGIMDDLRNQMRQRSASIIFAQVPEGQPQTGASMVGEMALG